VVDCPVDPAHEVVAIFTAALASVFTCAQPCPPIGDCGDTVRFFAGSAVPLAAWDAHATGTECAEPFLWVRVPRRFATEVFPTPAIDASNCSLPRVVAIEIGVGRCAVVGAEPGWDEYAHEAEVSLDDSWRVEIALCRAAADCRTFNHSVAIGDVEPFGPDGGVVAWLGVAYVQI
jgi:hypothetical protein